MFANYSQNTKTFYAVIEECLKNDLFVMRNSRYKDIIYEKI